MDHVENVGKICRAVLKLTDEDFNATIKMAEEQKQYNHPLKMATTIKQHALGEHNLKVVEALKNLKDVIEVGADMLK